MKRPAPDEVILGLLKTQSAHGYELLDYFRSDEKLGRIWTMSTSQLYAVLKRLEQEGAVVGREVTAPNAPPRTVFEITSLGEVKLQEWLFDPHPSASIHRIRVVFLSRVFIANLLDIPVGEVVKTQIAACMAQKDVFTTRHQKKVSEIEAITLDFLINQLESAVCWLEESNFDYSHQ